MEVKILIENFNHTMEVWIAELERYDYHQLCLQPNANSWSLGQVYTHLIEETEFFIQQIKACLRSNENSSGEMSAVAQNMLLNNSFPDEKLQGPEEAQYPPQPGSKAELHEDLIKLKAKINMIGSEISRNPGIGKTNHPGHKYLNAREWYQYAEMHLRHHFRQKERLDTFLCIK